MGDVVNTDIGEFSFGLLEFVVSEGHSSGDVQLAVGYSGLGLGREVLNGDLDLELTYGSG